MLFPTDPLRRGMLSNTLLGMGIGLLGQGPSLTPQSPLAGIGPGMMMANQLNQGLMMRHQMGQPQYQNVPGVGLVNLSAPGGPQVVPGMEAVPPEPEDPLKKFRAYQALPPEAQEQFKDFRRSGAMQIDMTGNKKIGLDAPKWKMPDGSEPSPGLTVDEVVALGGTPRSPAEMAVEKQEAVAEFEKTEAEKLLDERNEEYEAAIAKADREPTPENVRKAREAATAMGLARQGVWNERRELSGRMQQAITPPGYLGRQWEEGMGAVQKAITPFFRGLVGSEEQPPATPAPAPQQAGEVDDLVEMYRSR